MQFLLENETSINKFAEILKLMMLDNGGELELEVDFADYDEEKAMSIILGNSENPKRQMQSEGNEEQPFEIKSKKLELEEDTDLDALSEDDIRNVNHLEISRQGVVAVEDEEDEWYEEDEEDDEEWDEEEDDFSTFEDENSFTASDRLSGHRPKTLSLAKEEEEEPKVELSYNEYKQIMNLIDDVKMIKDELKKLNSNE